jgi:hypothetical protein
MKADAYQRPRSTRIPVTRRPALRGQILVMKGQSAEGKTLPEKACQLIPMIPRRNSNWVLFMIEQSLHPTRYNISGQRQR